MSTNRESNESLRYGSFLKGVYDLWDTLPFWFQLILWVFAFPLVLVFGMIRRDRYSAAHILVVIGVLVPLSCCCGTGILGGIVGGSSDRGDTPQAIVPSAPSIQNDEGQVPEPAPAPPAPANSQSLAAIEDVALREDFARAASAIGMNLADVQGLKRVEDWASGPRYSFSYQGLPFRIYCDMDSTVRNIKLGADSDVYKKGFEPYQVNQFIPAPGVISELQVESERLVTSRLNVPKSADFSWLGWSALREHDVYSLSSSVIAKNAFGVESEIPFSTQYYVKDGSARLVYFSLGSEVITDERSSVALPERQKLATEGSEETAPTQDGTVTITDGELGVWGREVTVDGEKYIDYFPPAGKYVITNKSRLTTVFLASDKYFTNSDGYQENEVFQTIQFTDYEQQETVTIGQGQHLELSVNSIIAVTPVR